ncbi:hypothetical protein M5X00_26335 [Paenibacillus alvei]|uniref:hypothetical protein n=1 Tax=Paenibacillus alvei TaxID=44250 RepID=UPI002280D42F|nr:hypothetical protein [Paenibacillus alvei]MCY9757751.1 hypothetical protein [Paenibacillus alvei]
MGKLLYLNKQDEGIARYMDSGIDASKLQKGVDFHIASIFLVDDNFEAHSLGEYIGKSSNELFQGIESGYIQVAKKIISGVTGLMETPYNKGVPFYRVKGNIDIDLATDVGLGVVRYQGEYYLYSPTSDDDPMDAIMEMIMLKVYFQLMNPNEVDQKLAASFSKFHKMILVNMTSNAQKHINRLKEIFAGV